MPQFNDHALTEQVLESFANTPDARLKTLITELVRSLHDYVRKTDLTFEEWDAAIDFLTCTGHTCTPTRQEFILLSDVLGVSMLVDAVNHREREGATETTVLGPFYVGEHKPCRTARTSRREWPESHVRERTGDRRRRHAARRRTGRRLAR